MRPASAAAAAHALKWADLAYALDKIGLTVDCTRNCPSRHVI